MAKLANRAANILCQNCSKCFYKVFFCNMSICEWEISRVVNWCCSQQTIGQRLLTETDQSIGSWLTSQAGANTHDRPRKPWLWVQHPQTCGVNRKMQGMVLLYMDDYTKIKTNLYAIKIKSLWQSCNFRFHIVINSTGTSADECSGEYSIQSKLHHILQAISVIIS